MKWIATVLITLVLSARAVADGGVPIATHSEGASTWTVLLRPASPRVGPVEFDLIGPDASEAQLELVEDGLPAVVHGFASDAPGARVAHVRTDLERVGKCVVRVRLPGSHGACVATLQVAAPAAGWTAQLPWLFAWVPMVVLLAVRERAARSYTARRA